MKHCMHIVPTGEGFNFMFGIFWLTPSFRPNRGKPEYSLRFFLKAIGSDLHEHHLVDKISASLLCEIQLKLYNISESGQPVIII